MPRIRSKRGETVIYGGSTLVVELRVSRLPFRGKSGLAMKYFKEDQEIWRNFVPKSGQADTVQGELLRAVEKLRDEAIRNGNGNWDEGFEILLNYLDAHLLDAAIYSADQIRRTNAALDRLRSYDDPCVDDDLYDELGDRVVEYFRSRGSEPHASNPRLRR